MKKQQLLMSVTLVVVLVFFSPQITTAVPTQGQIQFYDDSTSSSSTVQTEQTEETKDNEERNENESVEKVTTVKQQSLLKANDRNGYFLIFIGILVTIYSLYIILRRKSV
ncbi:hypothetical protein ACYSNW_02325 [Enterococcus sp. LJL99]